MTQENDVWFKISQLIQENYTLKRMLKIIEEQGIISVEKLNEINKMAIKDFQLYVDGEIDEKK